MDGPDGCGIRTIQGNWVIVTAVGKPRPEGPPRRKSQRDGVQASAAQEGKELKLSWTQEAVHSKLGKMHEDSSS